MAYIESFTVKGLAGRDVTVSRELDRHVNIFWGLNGTGKTSLLKILHSALRNETGMLEDVPLSSAEVTFWHTDDVKLRRTYSAGVSEGEDDDDDEGFFVEVQEDGSVVEVGHRVAEPGWTTEVLSGEISSVRRKTPFRHVYLPISRMSQVNRGYVGGPSTSSRRVVDDSYLDRQFAEQVQRRWQYYNAEANTRIRHIQQMGLASILAHLFGGGFGGGQRATGALDPEDAFNLVSGFLHRQRITLRFGRRDFVERYEADADLQQVVANIQEVTAEVEEAVRPQEQFQEVIQRLYTGGKVLEFDTARTAQGRIAVRAADGNQIPLRALSSGEKQLLRLMLEALAADDGVVLVDEPELSMHVDWQQELVESMRKVNPDCQLLLATHSPEIMADVSEELIFEL